MIFHQSQRNYLIIKMTQQLGWPAGTESFPACWGSPVSEITGRETKQKRTLERWTRDMENIPLKSWCCAQLVRCHVYEPPLWKQDGWCKGLPERVRFPLLALPFSCFISLPAARQGRDLFVPFLLLFSLLLLFHPPNATSAASCRMTSMRNRLSLGLSPSCCLQGTSGRRALS